MQGEDGLDEGAIRVVDHRSVRRSRQFSSVARACSTSARISAWDRSRPAGLGRGSPILPSTGCGLFRRRAGTVVGQHGMSALASVDGAVFAGRADVVDGSGQGRRGPQHSAEGIGEDLHVHAVSLVLAEAEWPVRGDTVDGQAGAVRSTTAFVDAARTASAKVGARTAERSTVSVT
jgi:hypothetical protein